MKNTRITLSLDEVTLRYLDELKRQLPKTRSEILRDAIRAYHARHIAQAPGITKTLPLIERA